MNQVRDQPFGRTEPATRGPADDSRERFGRYEIHELLGIGGMAHVHRATRCGISGFSHACALKRILPEFAAQPRYREAFVREARLTAGICHPNIRTAYDLGQVDGVYYIELELVEGLDLLQFLRRAQQRGGPPPLAVSLALLDQVCSAVDYLHHCVLEDGSEGIVHRDISPGNIMITPGAQVKLIDLGISAPMPDARCDRSGHRKGKLGYLSPEAYMGRPHDVRSDLFSIGVIAHELFTVRRLFRPQRAERCTRQLFEGTSPSPSLFNPEVSPLLDAWVMRALEPDPDKRWSSARAMRDTLAVALEDAGEPWTPAMLARWLSTLMAEPARAAPRRPAVAPVGPRFHEVSTLQIRNPRRRTARGTAPACPSDQEETP